MAIEDEDFKMETIREKGSLTFTHYKLALDRIVFLGTAALELQQSAAAQLCSYEGGGPTGRR